jgi:hypothetical protein
MGQCLLVTVDKKSKQPDERIAVYDARGHRIAAKFKDGERADCAELPDDYVVPETFAEAVRCAERIGQEFDYIRVDFMSTGSRLFFCECTVFPMGGFSIITGGIDEQIAAAWDLRNAWFMQSQQRGIRGLYQKLFRYVLDCDLSANGP